jgi:DNA polymerase III delta subunit
VLTIKEAATRAATHLNDLIPGAKNIQLEEVESTDYDKIWAITLSYYEADSLFGGKCYKILNVRKTDGEVLSMKIRSVRQQ